ncbi:unnamed protein product [Fraxinus pennsylvanica]|uniref:Uncharacterized protein n=1 Tax=Fraxinus pennsylvanica TaxID=56036 RepID=A0AAD2ACD9_9LAMI|nr:unnamed protein product [Fraxinus pennsylvanica]
MLYWNGKSAVDASPVGREIEALRRLRKFTAECKGKPLKGSKNGANESIFGTNFSCKISSWLAMGCLSPHSMFDELKKSTSGVIFAAFNEKDGGSSSSVPA